jgi:uncharacterized protein YqeY
MALEQQIEKDLKSALLNGDKLKVETLRGIKSAILYVKVADGTRNSVMDDNLLLPLLAKEAKKRQESIDLYKQAGDKARAEKEQREKNIIEGYLPQQLSEAELMAVVDAVIQRTGADNMAAMGKVIGDVKQETKGAADGALIAKLVKEKLANR